jgi:hypothetical protein
VAVEIERLCSWSRRSSWTSAPAGFSIGFRLAISPLVALPGVFFKSSNQSYLILAGFRQCDYLTFWVTYYYNRE